MSKGIPGFKETLDTMYGIMVAKNADYAGTTDPFANFMQVENLGISTAEKGILVRITDKLSRISNLLETEAQVKDEAITDTLQDMANYAVILKCLIEERSKPNPEHIKQIKPLVYITPDSSTMTDAEYTAKAHKYLDTVDIPAGTVRDTYDSIFTRELGDKVSVMYGKQDNHYVLSCAGGVLSKVVIRDILEKYDLYGGKRILIHNVTQQYSIR